MTYAITQSCCADASCVSACPVNCIHPTPDEPDFGRTDMLFIDPAICIDCGACADACPVDAAKPADQLTGPLAAYLQRNQDYFSTAAPAAAAAPGIPAAVTTAAAVTTVPGSRTAKASRVRAATIEPRGVPGYPRPLPSADGPLRVAVVGTGPSAGYTVQELLRCTDAEITLIDRNPVAGGLIRFGVAPDHPSTKRIGDTFARNFRHPRVTMYLGVTVGSGISHEDILAHHHAVVYATGAESPRALGIKGEDLSGSIAAMDFLAWANGFPGAPSPAGLDTGRAVVVGNGNVGIDVARLLLSGPDRLASSVIAPAALEALRGSAVSEVVLLARRGPADAAFAPKEFLGLLQLPGLEIVIDGDPGVEGEIAEGGPMSAAAELRGVPVTDIDWTAPAPDGPRLVLRFHSSPVAASGEGRVESVRVSDRNTGFRDIPAGMLIRSIGSRGSQIPGLPYDEATGIFPNTGGRISPGSYVTGWAKRGATGGIGANRACARETVAALLDDAEAGLLAAPKNSARAFGRLTRKSRGRN